LSRKGGTANKRIILYALIGILAISLVAMTTFGRGMTKSPEELARETQEKTIADNKVRFCGQDSRTNSNAYITEFVLPSECELPLGVAVGDDRVWYLSTKHGTLGSYSPATGKFEEFAVPSWPSRSSPDPAVFSMTWATKTDSAGNVWFTDDRQNLLWRFDSKTGNFDSFKSPAAGPISFDFDSDDNIYLVGVRSSSLYFGNVAQMRQGTLDGFTEIKLPLDAFSGIEFGVVSGSVAVDKERNVVWTTVLAFDRKGQIFSYDVDANEVSVYDLPSDLRSPVGTAVDGEGNLWVTDHATNIFFMLDPKSGDITRYSTSVLSQRILGAVPSARAYTLPYWIAADAEGRLWFNQHVGNKINRFDPSTQTMVEYWIPTQNPQWANCADGVTECGVANALQLSVGPSGQVWFTEWTENKIGRVNTETVVPLSVSAPGEVNVRRGDSAEIRVDVSSQADLAVQMVAAATFTSTGTLGDSAGIFSQNSVNISAGGSRQVSYVFTPATDLSPGQYVLMLGADQGDVAVLKAVIVNVV
jgi:virginiamycin B lyase